jgi:plasmid maintenance system antidote protein VapI
MSGEENITNDFAEELEKTLYIDAVFWMKLNELYNEELKTFEKSYLT